MSGEFADVVIVGNGVVGSSIAYELVRREPATTVTVIGPDARTGAASTAAGAMHNTFGEVTSHTLSSAAGRAKFELCRQALDRWRAWLDELGCASGHADLAASVCTGTTVLLNSRSGQLDEVNFAALLGAVAEYGEPHEEIDPATVPGLSPAADARPLRAVHLPREGAIDSRAVLAALHAAACRGGVAFRDAEAGSVRVRDGRAVGIELVGGQTVSAGTVVLAAGAFTEPLLAVLPRGAVPVLFAGKGIAVLTRRRVGAGFEHVVRTPSRSGACGLHLVPLGAGVEYLGASNLLVEQPAVVPDLGMSELLARSCCEQFDQQLFLSDMQRWLVGNRPVTIDGFPLVGRTGVAGLVVATGTYRDGFHCSPVLASMVVDDLLGKQALAEQLALFAPERAPIQTLTPEQSVAEFVLHGVSASIEAGLRGPTLADIPMLEFYHRAVAERFYDQLEHPMGLSPEVLAASVVTPDRANPRIVRYLAAAHARYGGA